MSILNTAAIPADIWIHVFTFLPLSSRLSMLQTCRRLFALSARCRAIGMFKNAELCPDIINQRGYMLAVRNACGQVLRAANLSTDGEIHPELVPNVANGLMLNEHGRMLINAAKKSAFARLFTNYDTLGKLVMIMASDHISDTGDGSFPSTRETYYRFCSDSNNFLALCGYIWLRVKHLSGRLVN